MSEQGKTAQFIKLMVKNALQFLFNLGFIMLFGLIFGQENILPGVAIGVGLTMFPYSSLDIKPSAMAGIIIGLYAGGVAVGQLALASPWVAFPVNFLFVLLMMALSCEPIIQRPAISFLLCFVFSQATPVAPALFPQRLIGAFVGGAVVAAVTLLKWRGRGISGGRGLREQVSLCLIRRGYLLRMALGISIAMLIGMLLHLKKPLWISIVVMSLTQLHVHEMIERIRHRTFGNLIGVVVFFVLFRLLIPERYAFAAVLLLGYISFFTSEYKYKQIVNAVCAINASLVLLDSSTAVQNRLFCLAGGALIVLALHGAEWLPPALHRLAEKHRGGLQGGGYPKNS